MKRKKGAAPGTHKTYTSSQEYGQHAQGATQESESTDLPALGMAITLSSEDGSLVLDERQVLRMLKRSALKPHRHQLLETFRIGNNPLRERLFLGNGPGGSLELQAGDVGSIVGAALGVALERMGCLAKLRIISGPGGGR